RVLIQPEETVAKLLGRLLLVRAARRDLKRRDRDRAHACEDQSADHDAHHQVDEAAFVPVQRGRIAPEESERPPDRRSSSCSMRVMDRGHGWCLPTGLTSGRGWRATSKTMIRRSAA